MIGNNEWNGVIFSGKDEVLKKGFSGLCFEEEE
jgi:hypothetical protein